MKKNIVKLFHLLSIVLILLFLFNCQEPSTESSEENTEENSKKDDPTPSLVGEWLSNWSELFIIAPNETPPMFYAKYYDADDNLVLNYAGEIVEYDDYSSSSGYITIQYTDNDNYPEVIGKFYRIHWKNLTVNTCNISGAFLYDASLPPEASDPAHEKYPQYLEQFSADTLSDAKNRFTVENGAFLGGSDCNKQ